ncbi:MAG TPA: 4-(cytidine 5'-diphospho)-2-C-methyl-D-erythritol kinase [Nevskiaceae bacterium]|nr:4-(cytidine 5'-diphospho)-2-C-methyl-D-erythritol kinase [Nevskiaceae bacterium]
MTRGLPDTWPAPAKLNLFLHVTGRRADGYHLLQTVFQFIDVCDTLAFRPRSDAAIRCVEGAPGVADDDNLAVRAARALQAASGATHGADIGMVKRIPLGAGLGGGSSDAATTLVALNAIWNLGLSIDRLAQIGLSLGADVPVFVRGHAAWGEGIGEKLQPVELPEPWYLVLVPPVAVPTREVFTAPALKRDSAPIALSDFLAGAGRNDCEPVTRALYPQVGEALDWLGRRAPARMSGTGAAVFAAFATRAEAEVIAETAPNRWRCFVAQGRNRSPLADIMRRV